jgi:hypothetical protein
MSEGRGAADQGLAVADPYDREGMLAEVLAGLRRPDKRISSKYHYDEVGSELFEEITRLEEYYPTRTERALLSRWMPVWVDELRPRSVSSSAPGARTSRASSWMRWFVTRPMRSTCPST